MILKRLMYRFLQSGVISLKNFKHFYFKKSFVLFTGITNCSFALSFLSSDIKKKIDDIDFVIREADVFYNNYLINNAYNVLRKFRSSNNSEILWRLARVLCEQAKQCKNLEEKQRLFNEALEIALESLKNEPESGCFGAHKWYAIILDYVGEHKGTKYRILNSYKVKQHLEKALQINPFDATTWHILGVWHFTFADMSPYVYMIARTIYSKPPISNYEEALRHFQKAESLSPGFYSSNIYYLALTKERLRCKDESLELFKKAFFMPVVTIDDKIIHEKALKHLISKYGMSEKKLLDQNIS